MPAFDKVQRDMSAYYLIGYGTSNLNKDLPLPDDQGPGQESADTRASIEARAGYYSESDFQHTAKTDRETQLQNQLFSAVSATDIPVLVSASFFRLAVDRYFVPIAVAVPGSAIPTPPEKDKDKMVLDFMGRVRDERGVQVGYLRQTMQLPAGSVGSVGWQESLYGAGTRRRAITGEGRRARERSGLMGSFEAASFPS